MIDSAAEIGIDKVHHQLFCHKIRKYGLKRRIFLGRRRSCVFQRMESFLHERLPVRPQAFHLKEQTKQALQRFLPQSGLRTYLSGKPAPEIGSAVALQQLIHGKQGLPVNPLLQVMGQGQGGGQPQGQGLTAVLQERKEQIPGVCQLGE